MCGGANCNTVFIFCDNSFSDVDVLLSIMFIFGSYPAAFNVSYNIAYSRKMSVSLLNLIGLVKIVLVTYAYKISMYCIPQFLVNRKCPVRYMSISPFPRSSRLMAENTDLVVSSLGETLMFLARFPDAHFLPVGFFTLVKMSKINCLQFQEMFRN